MSDYRPSESAVRFCEVTAVVAPALAPIHADHLEFYEEMLPHVYFGDVSRWATENISTSGPSPELVRLLDLLETSYPTAHEDVQNLIDVSFVENVQDDPAMVRLLGPTLLSRVHPQYQPK